MTLTLTKTNTAIFVFLAGLLGAVIGHFGAVVSSIVLASISLAAALKLRQIAKAQEAASAAEIATNAIEPTLTTETKPMEKIEFLHAYIAATLNKMPEEWGEPCTFSGLQIAEILWPLNDFFRSQLSSNLNITYQAQFEAQADEAIMAYIMEGSEAWQSLPVEVWRVLLERHLQSLMVASVNELSNPNFFTVPKALPEASLLGAAMIFLMYKMKLPFAVKPLTADALPPVGFAAKPLLH